MIGLLYYRSASHHSRTAQNAFLRGDHFSAQQFSLKAREEWSAAEKLNAEAAKEILQIRNCENDLWKLDLHGLHATEATQALREHLQKIETHISVNQTVFPYGTNKLHQKDGVVSSLESLNGTVTQNLDRPQAPRQRPLALQVITGTLIYESNDPNTQICIYSTLLE